MNSITKASRSRRIFAPHELVKSHGKGVKIYYACPKDYNDRKRWGREMSIQGDGFTIKLGGRAINSIKSVLEQAGELSKKEFNNRNRR